MLAIAVSSEAIARAVKIAAAAQFRRSAGKPSIAAGISAEIVSVDIRNGLPIPGCRADTGRPAGGSVHAAYATGNVGECRMSWSMTDGNQGRRCGFVSCRLLAVGFVLVADSDRAGITNQDPDVGDSDAFVVNEDKVCRAKAQRLENDRAVAVGTNNHGIRISDHDGLERPLKPEPRAGTEPQGDRLI